MYVHEARIVLGDKYTSYKNRSYSNYSSDYSSRRGGSGYGGSSSGPRYVRPVEITALLRTEARLLTEEVRHMEVMEEEDLTAVVMEAIVWVAWELA